MSSDVRNPADFQQPSPASPNDLPPGGPVDLTHILTTFFRMAGQILGAILLIIGVYYSLSIFFQILAAGRDPQLLETGVQRMTTLLGLETAKFKFEETEIPLGRSAGFSALCMWYFLTMWIPLSLIGVGTRLIWGPMAERKAFYNALEEYFRTARLTGQDREKR